MTLTDLFQLAAERHASDLHLASGEPPRLRIEGDLLPLEEPVDLPALLAPILGPEASARLRAGLPFETTLAHGDLAFHGVVFRVGDAGLAATFRMIAREAPSLATIAEGAEGLFQRIVDAPRGLVLVVGPTGSGKWTTVCAVANAINARRAARIFVATATPSYLFENRRGMVTALRVGGDVGDYVSAMEIAHKADLDAMALDDLPNLEALRQALVLADTGHLVIANLNVPTAADALARLLETAGDETPALRRALAENLVAVTGQRLAPRVGGGRLPVYEWIVNTPRVREALLSGSDVARAQEEDPECRTVGEAARDLYMQGKLAIEDAARIPGANEFVAKV